VQHHRPRRSARRLYDWQPGAATRSPGPRKAGPHGAPTDPWSSSIPSICGRWPGRPLVRPEQARARPTLGHSHSGESGRVAPCFPRQAGAPSADRRFSFDHGSGSACRRGWTARRSTASPRGIGMRLSTSAGVDPGACAASAGRAVRVRRAAPTRPRYVNRHVGTRLRRCPHPHDPGRSEDCRRRASAVREWMPSLR
jgi:hypothetical protein